MLRLSNHIVWILKSALIISLCLFSFNSFAAAKNPLSADQAFVLSTSFNKNNEFIAHWKISPGYYLYKNHMQFSFQPDTKVDIRYPQAILKNMDQKRLEVYAGEISVPVKLQANEATTLQLNLSYQGCSEEGFCYPPIEKNILLNLINHSISSSDGPEVISAAELPDLLTDQQGIQNLLQTQHFAMTLVLFLGLGLLLAFTPCILPMIPILTGIIVGQHQNMTTRKAFLLSLTYVLGTAITYAFLGMLAAAMGSMLQVALQRPSVIAISSVVFMLLAFSLFGFYDLRMPNRLNNRLVGLSNKQQGGQYLGVFCMGILSSLIVSPCVTAPLVGVLLYIAQSGSLFLGASALFALGIGMGLPLLLIGTTEGKWLPKSGPWMEAVKKSCGFVMLGMAIWLIARVIPDNLVLIFWSLLLFAIALFFGFYLPRLIGQQFLNRSLAILVGVLAISTMFASAGISNPLFPWTEKSQASFIQDKFITVRSIQELNKQLLIAQASKQPVVLDYYATWCESCVSMDKNVFKSPQVQHQLKNYKLLRADLSDNTSADELLMKKFAVIAPPTVLFFDAQGREMNSQRIVGEVNASEFLTRLGLNDAK